MMISRDVSVPRTLWLDRGLWEEVRTQERAFVVRTFGEEENVVEGYLDQGQVAEVDLKRDTPYCSTAADEKPLAAGTYQYFLYCFAREHMRASTWSHSKDDLLDTSFDGCSASWCKRGV